MINMHVLWFNACLLAICISIAGVQSEAVIHEKKISAESDGAIVTQFLRDHTDKVLELAQLHFNLSLNYLYTSYGYKSQVVQREGLGKYLKEQSDTHWKDGMGIYQKYMQRGGNHQPIKNKFNFNGKNDLIMTKDSVFDIRDEYMVTMKGLLVDSKRQAMEMNDLHRLSERRSNEKTTSHHDGEWGHYFEEKLEKEAERTREMAGHVTDLEKMVNSTMALFFFDSNL